MTPGAYLFELQYPSNIWNTVLRHSGIPCFMAAKKKKMDRVVEFGPREICENLRRKWGVVV